ncbi:hypothetical protein UPYG_G00033280 [Umbra pygmaea]|uniref:Plasmalemma vesicle-associated protein n=1 Tax=Umbra pygmaea TaxID=75934 RepID=A0ABD0Y1T8_UMBPY
MYSSKTYSRTKFGLEARDIHKPKGKSCGYYMRILFFFSSLIQSLIIVSLVLFLVYGQPEKSAEEKRVEEMEQSMNRISENNINLRKEKADLGAALAARTAEKTALEGDLAKLRKLKEYEDKQRLQSQSRSIPPMKCPPAPVQTPVVSPNNEVKSLQSVNAHQAALFKLIEANFTQTTYYIRMERDNAIRDRDAHHLETINLRRENANLKEQLTLYAKKCKEDFAKSLEGIQTVTSNFLLRIEKLFPHSTTFHLTCEKQSEYMDNIRTNCSSLSKEVEDKFQRYLDNVGTKVADIQSKSSLLEVQTSYLTLDLQHCRHNRSVTAAEASRLLQERQQNHDKQVETLLKEQNRLRDEKTLQGERLALREAELKTLNEKVQSLTSAASHCNSKQPGGPKPAGMLAPEKRALSVGPAGISQPLQVS